MSKPIRSRAVSAMRISLLVLCVAQGIVLAQSYQTGLTMTVDAGTGLNLRQQPSATASVIALIPKESAVALNRVEPQAVTVSGKSGYWLGITWQGKEGYAFSPYLKLGGASKLTFDGADKIAYAYHYAEGGTGQYSLNKENTTISYKSGTLTLTDHIPPLDEIITVVSGLSGDIEFVEGYPAILAFRIEKVSHKWAENMNKYRIQGKLISVKTGERAGL